MAGAQCEPYQALFPMTHYPLVERTRMQLAAGKGSGYRVPKVTAMGKQSAECSEKVSAKVSTKTRFPGVEKGHDKDVEAAAEEDGDMLEEEGLEAAGGDDDWKDDDAPKRRRNNGAGVVQMPKGFHDIPVYPLETRIITRVYTGPLRRGARYSSLRDAMYGPSFDSIKLVWDLQWRWREYPVLPPKHPPAHAVGIVSNPWLPVGFERQQLETAFRWYDRLDREAPHRQRSKAIQPVHVQQNSEPAGEIVTLVGPWDDQSEHGLEQGSGITLTHHDRPTAPHAGSDGEDHTDDRDQTPIGYVMDAGAIPLSVAWAPLANSKMQILAVAAVPFSDQTPQEADKSDEEETEARPRALGSLQFWGMDGDMDEDGLATPSRKPARLFHLMYFDWGRPKRLQWCPVPLDPADITGLLAILCADGKTRVIEVASLADTEWLETPIATLATVHDYNVQVTCQAWVNTNRIVLGHSDGTLTLWSVHPQKLLQRIAVHHTYVIDVCSAYPSKPYLVASVPVGGVATLTDLCQPSSEFTYFPVPSINLHPNSVCWSETTQGFLCLYPASTPSTTIAFMHHKFFPQARSICTGPSTVTTMSAGSTHPFILMGCLDGSVFCCNAMHKLFKQKRERVYKLRVVEHEYRPLPAVADHETAPVRGVVRFLQGFRPERNHEPSVERRREFDRRKAAKKSRNQAKKMNLTEEEDQPDAMAELDEQLASRLIIHEPLTRATMVAWNPNMRFSCWAAICFASGLIRVMDLGVK